MIWARSSVSVTIGGTKTLAFCSRLAMGIHVLLTSQIFLNPHLNRPRAYCCSSAYWELCLCREASANHFKRRKPGGPYTAYPAFPGLSRLPSGTFRGLLSGRVTFTPIGSGQGWEF